MGDGGGQGDQDSLRDESELDESVIGVEFPADGGSVAGSFPVQVLVARVALEGGHAQHPEAVEEGADDAQGVLEGEFDFGAVAIPTGGKGHTEYISKESRAMVERQTANYRRFRELIQKWVDAEIELCKIKLRETDEG